MSDLQAETREDTPEGENVACEGLQDVETGEGEGEGATLARAGVGSSVGRNAGYSGKRGGLGRKVRHALREVASGSPHRLAASRANVSPVTVFHAIRSPAGQAYLARHRERVDAHRVLLAATLPYLELARMISEGKRGRASAEAYGEGEGSAGG